MNLHREENCKESVDNWEHNGELRRRENVMKENFLYENVRGFFVWLVFFG